MSRRKIRKPFLTDFLFEREELWLNQMAAQGWNLVRPGTLRSTFDSGEPGEWVYRIQVLPQSAKKTESVDYFEFMRSTGVELAFARDQLAYFRKRSCEGPFDLFTDRESRLAYTRNLRNWWIGQSALALILAAYPVINLLPAGSVTEKPWLDWTVLIVWVALLMAAVVFNGVRLRSLNSRLRDLEG
jgi:hypothetical protein